MSISVPTSTSSTDHMTAWLRHLIAKEKRVDATQIDVDTPLEELGLDSMAGVTLSGEIDMALNMAVPPTLLWDYPTVGELARHLVSQLSGRTEASSS